MASFQAKTVRDWLRMIIKRKVIVPIHLNPYLNREFQKNSKKLKNIAVAFFQAKTGRDRLIMREKKLKKLKKLKNIIMASFQAKTGRDRLKVMKKKCYHSDLFQSDPE